MASALVRHDELSGKPSKQRRPIAQSMGEGDSTVSVFDTATHAMQGHSRGKGADRRGMAGGARPQGPIRAHTGEAELAAPTTSGPPSVSLLVCAAKPTAAQIFLSSVTAELCGEFARGVPVRGPGPASPPRPACARAGLALAGPNISPPLPATDARTAACRRRSCDVASSSVARKSWPSSRLVWPRSRCWRWSARRGAESSVLRGGLVGAAQDGLIAGVTSVELCTPGPMPSIEHPAVPVSFSSSTSSRSCSPSAPTRSASRSSTRSSRIRGRSSSAFAPTSTVHEHPPRLARAVAGTRSCRSHERRRARRAITEPARVRGAARGGPGRRDPA